MLNYCPIPGASQPKLKQIDERIDKPDWLKFREKINSELEKRKAEQNA